MNVEGEGFLVRKQQRSVIDLLNFCDKVHNQCIFD